MPRNPNNDSPIGTIITKRLEEMERPQTWLARKVACSNTTIGFVVKGRLKPSDKLIQKIAKILEITPEILLEARIEEQR